MGILSRTAGLGLLFVLTGLARADEPLRLREAFPSGYQYHVNSRVELSGSLSLPPEEKSKPAPKPLSVTGSSVIEYDERVLASGADGQVSKTARIYRNIDFQRKVGEQAQNSTIRPAVRRLIVMRLRNTEVPFSPDGPLTWGEIDLVRTDVFTPALNGLLSDQPVRPGDRWTASEGAVAELTDLESIEGRLECRLEQVTILAGRRHARISLAGTVKGTNEDGPTRQQLEGYFFFDLESQHLSYLYIKGVHSLLDKDGKEFGRVEGRFVLTRQAHQRSADLSDSAMRTMATEPNADNTLLLYDNPDLGVRLLYPRRWRVAGVRGRQLALDETNGSGLLLTLEPPARVPTGAELLAESRDYLTKQKARVLKATTPQRVQAAPQELEHFGLEIDVSGQRAWMDYYVARQRQGGATLAARLLPADRANLLKEVERIARSLTVTKPIEVKPPVTAPSPPR